MWTSCPGQPAPAHALLLQKLIPYLPHHHHHHIKNIRVTPDSIVEHTDTLGRFNIGEDCPIFDSLFDYCRQYSGASLAAARKLASGSTDIAVNWTGGLHHAKKVQASGFCYINDIVLAILELLR